ncbi:MAG TPA: hypothetical protein PKL83_02320 [bacterium]|nr:hypothetical protein [bacterium]
MTYEDKRKDLIKTIAFITILILSGMGIIFGIFTCVFKGSCRRTSLTEKTGGLATRLKKAFHRFSEGGRLTDAEAKKE